MKNKMIDAIMNFSVIILFLFPILIVALIIGIVLRIKKVAKSNVAMKAKDGFEQTDVSEKTEKPV